LPLAQVFLARGCAQTGRPRARLSTAAGAALLANPWLGNVRQLQNVIFRAVTMSEAPVIDTADLELASAAATDSGVLTDDVQSLDDAVAGFERGLLQRLFVQYPSSRKLAQRLHTSHSAIAIRLRKYGIGL
jgi:TyrR family helix-turn-helix protein